jgi:proton glutamate symport protein
MKKIALHWQILIGIILGVLFAFYLPVFVPGLSILGKLFIKALKMIVVPLIVSSLICGVTNIQSGKSLGRIGGKTLLYYMITSVLALLTGLFLVNFFKPGANLNIPLPNIGQSNIKEVDIKDTILNIIPDNIFNALSSNKEMLAIIFFSIIFGIFITKIQSSKKQLLINVFDAVFDVMMKLTLFVIKFAPLGVMGIVAEVIHNQMIDLDKLSNQYGMEVLTDLMIGLGRFSGVVIGGLAIHIFITLPILLYITSKTNPIKHYKAMLTVLLTAFSTASSNATLPLTLETIEEKSGVSNKISSFTLPLGATINMDGTGLYELVVAGFIAQIYGHDLDFTHQFILVATALLASVGTAGVPMASFVTMTIIFTAVGLPIEAMGIILIVDRPLDMIRTATNVLSDTCGTVIIAKSEKEELNY